ncbi:MAG TPA: choice-of-anchor tandem repeat NxxGxxAF-containing protein [Blastocatellia bacterium]|nr:choice-of-anchor tandem repeat NxxGxxAF-containing protein [Blastocatellia bacterium]
MRSLVVSRKLGALAIITTQILSVPTLVVSQTRGFGITPIVKRGDPVSDGGRFFDCADCQGRVIGQHAFNNRGDVTIAAEVVSGLCFSNRFLISGGESIRLADFCRTTEFGKLTFLGPVNINDNGHAAINAGVTIDNRIVEMILLSGDRQPTKVVQEGEISPIGTIFKGCGFGQPAINNNGEVAFFACGETSEGRFSDGVYRYSAGDMSKVVVSEDPSPIGGTFALNFVPAQPVQMNDRGDVLFRAGVFIDPAAKERFGLFLATNEGFRKVEIDGERLPGGEQIKDGSFGIGDLNSKGDVAFVVGLAGQSDGGIFLYSGGSGGKVVMAGDPSPIGGTFSPFDRGETEPFPLPHINGNGAVAFKAL